jgi:hypothetical protein
MPLEPLLPSERIELAIYRSVAYFGQEWTTNVSSLLGSIQHFRVQATNVSVVERLENLEADHNIDLTKWAGGRSTSRSEWGDAEKFFYVDDFRIAITPVGRKYFESLEQREGVLSPNGTVESKVFISHIAEEKAVALVLQKYVQLAFRNELPVFVASDKTSIGGGRKWFEHIIGSLRLAKVVLSLVSQESHTRPWINFEAGFGDGAEAVVIPIAIKGFSLGNLKFPLAGYNGRPVDDIEGILLDIARETHNVAEKVDHLQFTEDMQAAEDSLTYKSLVMKPVKLIRGGSVELIFEMSNQGNTDVELLFVEATILRDLCAGSWSPTLWPNTVEFDTPSKNGKSFLNLRYWSYATANIQRLPPVLTRSMGTIRPKYLSFQLNQELIEANNSTDDTLVTYQIHARGYDTVPESTQFNDIERRGSRGV